MFVKFVENKAWILLTKIWHGFYVLYIPSEVDPKKSGYSGFKYVLFDIELGLTELKGTVGPWWKYAL